MKDRGLAKKARQAVGAKELGSPMPPAILASKRDFRILKTAVAERFAAMQKGSLFRVDLDGDTIWSRYLSSFPPGSNQIFRERPEYDCSCCRHFVRTLGNVVSIENGELVSIWDVEIDDPAFSVVATSLSEFVKSAPIAGPFAHYEATAGTHQSFEMDPERAPVRTWEHFFVNIDRRHVKSRDTIPTWLSEQRSRHDVFLRSLREISIADVETVLDLIAQGSLYRGEEHRPALTQFHVLKARFDVLGGDITCWQM